MSIISYAQNFEDVMLWRALGHIERGFYIDIGAQDPTIDSVSRAFHEHGWHGIHVEPTPHYAELLRQQRPGDTVIQAAVGNGPALSRFYEIPNTGISTADAGIAAQHRERGFDVQEIIVTFVALSAIFDTCAEEIHWLKIDVEGFEQQLLSSWGTSAARPWIVVVESTLPLTQTETHENWESIIIDYGYSPVYFDGLNRYYVSDAHAELKAAFASPPNVFDGFTLNGTASAPFHRLLEERYQEKISQASALSEQQKASLQEEATRLNADQLSLAEQTRQARQELETLHHAYAKREQEVAERFLAIQQQAALEKEEIARSQSEQDRIQQGQLSWLQQERVTREQTLHEQTSQVRQEIEKILRSQTQRELEITSQLRAVQLQAEQSRDELVRSHSEQERTLHGQLAEREKSYAENTRETRLELESLLRNQAQREQQLAAQLLDVKQQAEREKIELIGKHHVHALALQSQHDEREKGHVEQATQARLALEIQLRQHVQREQQIAAQLIDLQQQAAREKTELVNHHGEQARALHNQVFEREQSFGRQLLLRQEELHEQHQSRMDRAQEIAAKLLNLQQQAAQDAAAQARNHREQERTLSHQHVAREDTLKQCLQAMQEEVHRLQKERARREQEVGEQLVAIQQVAFLETAEQTRKHLEQSSELHRLHAEREQFLCHQLEAGKNELRNREQDWERREKEHAEQAGQSQQAMEVLLRDSTQREQEINAQLLTIQQQAQQEKAEQLRLLHACAAMETQLQAEMQSGQQVSTHLRHLLSEIQHNLDLTHASLSWRMTAPLRRLMEMFGPSKDAALVPIDPNDAPTSEPSTLIASEIPAMPDPASEPITHEQSAVAAPETPSMLIATSASDLMTPKQGTSKAIEAPPIATSSEPLEPTTPQLAHPTAKNMTTNATTISELLALHDQKFVRGAYKTLLGRSPDPEGFHYYLDRVRTGFSKIQIIAQLCFSNEGKAYASKLPGLDSALQHHQKEQRSFVGRVVKCFNGAEGNSSIERKLRAIENQMFLFDEKSQGRFDQIEAAISNLHHFIATRPPLTETVPNNIPVDAPVGKITSPIHVENSSEPYKLSPRSREFYSQIKSVASNNAQRCL